MTEPTDDPGMLSPAAGSLETTYGVITHRDDAVCVSGRRSANRRPALPPAAVTPDAVWPASA
jgi:hypothetical protein